MAQSRDSTREEGTGEGMKAKRMQVKRVPERVMRGWQGLRGWLLLIASGPGKRWEPQRATDAWTSLLAFVAYRSSNERWARETKRPMNPIRLLGPGGIIVAEHGIRIRNDKRTAKRPLKDTGALRSSIMPSSPLSPTGNLRGSGLAGSPGYPFLTMRDPRRC